MSRTGLKRPAFYAHFGDRHELVLLIVQDIGGELFEMSDRGIRAEIEPRYRTADHLAGALRQLAKNSPETQRESLIGERRAHELGLRAR